MTCDRSCYKETLGLPASATPQEVRKAYKKLRSQAHPDKNGGSAQAKERFQRIQAAYEVLTGARQPGPASCTCGRAAAQPRQDPPSPFRAKPPEDPTAAPDAQPDKHVRIHLTLAEMFKGGVVPMTDNIWGRCESCAGRGYRTSSHASHCRACDGSGTRGHGRDAHRCTDCNGTGKTNTTECPGCRGLGMRYTATRVDVPVPPRTAPGNDITMKGAGHRTKDAARPGNLVVNVIHDLTPDSRGATLHGLDVEVPVQLDCLAAALGGTTKIDVLGASIEVNIPSRVSPGTWITVRQEGLRAANGRTGDLHIYISGFDVIHPLDEKTRAALRAVLAEEGQRKSG
ncbi:DnaJ C-terminal domain-containing protein [Bordetella genomosp. 13]|uniref:DnaJ C-terminal domain-containing protein n=1 Tax=Bordetella genomosp. 13 TaxID=463040 RepID=UPI0011AAAADC|nr:DnaJ C-terminal domain-containing protein [Bordetella genomosp. 13]